MLTAPILKFHLFAKPKITLKPTNLFPISFASVIKGAPARTRPPETLTNADFKLLYRTNILFLTTSVYFQKKKIELIQHASFMDVEKE